MTSDRRGSRREAKTVQILTAAWDLARRDGLAGISLRDLADQVGLRQPSLYVYFASKNELYDRMFTDGYQQLLGALNAQRVDDDPRVALSDMVALMVQQASDDPVRHQLLFQRPLVDFEPGEGSWSLAVEFFDFATRRLAGVGVTDTADVDLFTAVIAGLSAQQVANDPGGTRWVEQADRIVTILVDAVARPASSPS